MARDKAFRIHKKAVKATRRRKLADNWCMCAGKISKSGEKISCSYCETDAKCNNAWNEWETRKLNKAFWLSFEE